jgi:hypothetical protein
MMDTLYYEDWLLCLTSVVQCQYILSHNKNAKDLSYAAVLEDMKFQKQAELLHHPTYLQRCGTAISYFYRRRFVDEPASRWMELFKEYVQLEYLLSNPHGFPSHDKKQVMQKFHNLYQTLSRYDSTNADTHLFTAAFNNMIQRRSLEAQMMTKS